MKEIITSRDNATVHRYTLLATSRKERDESGLFVTEGIKLTTDAAQICTLQMLFATENAQKKYELSKIGEVITVSDSVSKKLSQAVTPQGVFGIFEKPKQLQIDFSSKGRYLLLTGLQDPGNVGTILRTAAALGITGVILSPDSPDAFAPKVLRASMGGVFRLAMETRDISETIEFLRKNNVKIWAAALDNHAVSLREAELGMGCAVLIGNEGAGLSNEMLALCDNTVIIPMTNESESLNAAMAAGILLWEMMK